MKAKLLQLFFLIPLVFLLAGCMAMQVKHVDSYEEVKKALMHQSNLAFPDIAFFEERFFLTYEVRPNRLCVEAREYSIFCSLDSKEITLGKSPEVVGFVVAAQSLASSDSDVNTLEPVKVTEVYRGIPIEEGVYDYTDRVLSNAATINAWRARDFELPLDEIVALNLSYLFDLDNCRYQASLQVILLHDESEGVSLDEKIAPYRGELFALVDSVLDERGVAP